jgi:hypothetical protein
VAAGRELRTSPVKPTAIDVAAVAGLSAPPRVCAERKPGPCGRLVAGLPGPAGRCGAG